MPAARQFAAETLRWWELAEWERAGDVLLCVSELATNALLHGVPPGRQFLLFLRCNGRVLHVEVHDSGPGHPRVAERRGEGGHGLLLVAALSDDWGVRERELGKVVWCAFGCDQLLREAMIPYAEDSARIGDGLDDLCDN